MADCDPHRIRILLIDDHALLRAGAKTVLAQAFPDADICEADSVSDALGERAAPSVVVLDVRLAGVSGVEGLIPLRRAWPEAPVVMLSSYPDAETIREAMARGATAFVSKAEPSEHLLSAVRRALGASSAGSAVQFKTALTPRQIEVLDLVCQGLSNKAIAARLHVSEFTVRGHVRVILSVLDVSSRSEAAFVARLRGLIV
jgi:DNA-binding NarL/FixJ family response regulator